MATIVSIGSLALLAVACLAGLVSLVVGFPGTFVILGAALLYAWGTGFASVTWSTIAWLAALALAGELFELLIGSGLGAASRPSWRVASATVVGSFVGGLLGAPLFFGVGALLGALAGAFAGAGLAAHLEGKTLGDALRQAWSALKSRFVAFVTKSFIAIAMTVLVLVHAW